jgi:DNA-binding transcriptional LysR family regulator
VVFEDPLFVRTGRNIEATERAIALREPVQKVLDDIKSLAQPKSFDPCSGRLDFVIAANDFQRDLIFPSLFRQLRNDGVAIGFRFISSGIPEASVLRQSRCDLMLTPFPPDGPDIYQIKLFDDNVVCFYDGNMRNAPSSIEELSQSEFVEVRIGDEKSSLEALFEQVLLEQISPVLSVPSFDAIQDFIKGTTLITAAVSLLRLTSMSQLDSVPLPFKIKPFSMYMVWHKRNHTDLAHRWLRLQVQEFVATALARSTGSSSILD